MGEFRLPRFYYPECSRGYLDPYLSLPPVLRSLFLDLESALQTLPNEAFAAGKGAARYWENEFRFDFLAAHFSRNRLLFFLDLVKPCLLAVQQFQFFIQVGKSCLLQTVHGKCGQFFQVIFGNGL